MYWWYRQSYRPSPRQTGCLRCCTLQLCGPGCRFSRPGTEVPRGEMRRVSGLWDLLFLLLFPVSEPIVPASQADLSNYDNVRELHKAVKDGLGEPDILFCNSGILGKTIGPKGDIEDVSIEHFEETWRTNTGVHYLVCTSYTLSCRILSLTLICSRSLLNCAFQQWNPRNGDVSYSARGAYVYNVFSPITVGIERLICTKCGRRNRRSHRSPLCVFKECNARSSALALRKIRLQWHRRLHH